MIPGILEGRRHIHRDGQRDREFSWRSLCNSIIAGVERIARDVNTSTPGSALQTADDSGGRADHGAFRSPAKWIQRSRFRANAAPLVRQLGAAHSPSPPQPSLERDLQAVALPCLRRQGS
ncbi:hypothetical protein GCM10011504_22200 [Siccirubricoccus deserti]|nr:hypothetical protein GCM10011504_22200 [Siccirubricoccus deserti]